MFLYNMFMAILWVYFNNIIILYNREAAKKKFIH